MVPASSAQRPARFRARTHQPGAPMPDSRISEGLPHPLGATPDGDGVNFAVFSAHATRVEVCIFDETGERERRSHHAAGIHGRGLARRSRASAPGPSTACGRTVRTSRIRSPFQPEQAAARPVRAGPCRRAEVGSAVFGYTIGHDGVTSRSTSATARRSCPSASSPTLRAACAPGSMRGALGQDDHLRDPRPRLHEAAIRTCPGGLRGTFAGLGAVATSSRTSRTSASPRSSCCRSTPSSMTVTCSTRA